MATPTQSQFPDDFRCPISLELMSDPVILPSGHTFDRPSIQRWLDSGHRSCPITKTPLPQSPSLVPNHALRSLISNFTLPPTPNPKPDPQTLIAALTSASSSADAKLAALSQICKLLRRDAPFRRRVADSGAVAAVLRLCGGDAPPQLQEAALNLLLGLSLDDDHKVGLVAEGAVARVVAALRGGASPGARAVAATVLTSLAVVEVNKATIGAHPNAMRSLIFLLRDGRGRERKEAATAIYALCSSIPDNRRRAVESGAVPVLIRAAASGLDRAVEVLALLARSEEGREEMGRFDGCVTVLVGILRNGSARGVQYGLLALSSLCCFNEEMGAEARRDGVLEICEGLLEDDNEKIRRNASGLIRVLQRGNSTG